MRQTITFLSLLIMLCSFSIARADKRAEITFEKSKYDFGTIKEKAGDATCEFVFKNTGEAPLLIIRAQASCGCTSPLFPKEPIRPGETGKISVTYHAKGRPGPFQKSVYVYDNSAPNHRSTLIISGNVDSELTPEETYKHQAGAGLLLKTNTVNFFDIYPSTSAKTRSIGVYNNGETPLQMAFKGMPKHIYVESEPAVIAPHSEGKIMITYYPKNLKDWGTCKDVFEVYVKGKETQMGNNKVTVIADMWEDFSNLTKREKENAPTIDINTFVLDFGKTSKATKLSIPIKNTGKDKLIVRKIQNSEPNIFNCSVKKDILKSGESTVLEVTFVPNKCKLQNITHHITLITNDPSNSRVIINMTASK